MQLTLRHKCNFWTFLSLRIGFAIYAGWVNAATILNVSIWLRSIGVKDPGLFISEDTFAVIILWVALIIYVATTMYNRNPIFGLIYIWVLMAIR